MVGEGGLHEALSGIQKAGEELRLLLKLDTVPEYLRANVERLLAYEKVVEELEESVKRYQNQKIDPANVYEQPWDLEDEIEYRHKNLSGLIISLDEFNRTLDKLTTEEVAQVNAEIMEKYGFNRMVGREQIIYLKDLTANILYLFMQDSGPADMVEYSVNLVNELYDSLIAETNKQKYAFAALISGLVDEKEALDYAEFKLEKD